MVRNTLDRKLRTPETVEQRFDTAVVGLVPAAATLAHKKGEKGTIVVDIASRRSEDAVVGEAFRKLRTNLLFMDIDNRPRVIVMTSPRPGDGKSTIAANLAAAVAMGGERVILIDADLRRPTLATALGLVDGIGLTDVLVGQAEPDEVLQEVANHRNLQVMAAGRTPPNPSELLGSKTMHTLIERLSANAIVILDAPPLLAVTDAAVLTANADGALVVISAGQTIDSELQIAMSELEAVNGRALGVIMNKVPRKGAGAAYYSNYYGSYTADAPAGAQRVPDEDSEPTTRTGSGGSRRRA
jgi:capsular exopolysaccharide synthesis family protein